MKRTIQLDGHEAGLKIQELARRAERLREERREIIDTAEQERRDLTRKEALSFDATEADESRLLEEIEQLKQLQAAEPRGLREVRVSDYSGTRPSGLTLAREERMADWQAERSGSAFTGSEGRSFSLGKIVRGMVTGSWEGAEVERRALSEGTNSAGGFLTPESLASAVIDRVRNQARVFEAGARTVPMNTDTLSIPRLASGVTGAWRLENTAVAESDPTFERVTFTAHTLAVLTRISYELLMDMTPEGAQIIEEELIRSLAIELDRVALRGSGTAPEPRGIKNQTGVTTQTNGANGGVMSYPMLVNAVAAIDAAGFNANAAIVAPRTTKSLAGLVDTTGQPLLPPNYLDGLKLLVTNQLPINLTTGSSTDTSEIYVGQWDQLLIGVRPSVRIDVERSNVGPASVSVVRSDSRYMDAMQVGILAYLRADVQVAHPEAFVVSTGVRP